MGSSLDSVIKDCFYLNEDKEVTFYKELDKRYTERKSPKVLFYSSSIEDYIEEDCYLDLENDKDCLD
tara:strand:+ start:164 stop:364 length:201 start_codon:yes stop_codon:yes gene_type:complete